MFSNFSKCQTSGRHVRADRSVLNLILVAMKHQMKTSNEFVSGLEIDILQREDGFSIEVRDANETLFKTSQLFEERKDANRLLKNLRRRRLPEERFRIRKKQGAWILELLDGRGKSVLGQSKPFENKQGAEAFMQRLRNLLSPDKTVEGGPTQQPKPKQPSQPSDLPQAQSDNAEVGKFVFRLELYHPAKDQNPVLKVTNVRTDRKALVKPANASTLEAFIRHDVPSFKFEDLPRADKVQPAAAHSTYTQENPSPSNKPSSDPATIPNLEVTPTDDKGKYTHLFPTGSRFALEMKANAQKPLPALSTPEMVVVDLIKRNQNGKDMHYQITPVDMQYEQSRLHLELPPLQQSGFYRVEVKLDDAYGVTFISAF